MAAGVLAGFLVGVPLGFLNRLYMRITALMAGHVEGFSWGGTLGVVLVTVLPFALPTGLLFPPLRRWMRGGLLVQGSIYGLLLLLVFGLPFLWAAPMGLNTTGSKWVNRLMYGSLFVLQGLSLPFVFAWVERRLSAAQGRMGRMAGYGALALLGLGGCGLLGLLAFQIVKHAA